MVYVSVYHLIPTSNERELVKTLHEEGGMYGITYAGHAPAGGLRPLTCKTKLSTFETHLVPVDGVLVVAESDNLNGVTELDGYIKKLRDGGLITSFYSTFTDRKVVQKVEIPPSSCVHTGIK